MVTRIVVVVVALLAPSIAWADAAYDASDEFIYPLVTRRPFLDREFELRVDHEKGAAGRVTDLRGSLEIPVLPRWRGGLEGSLLFTHPRAQPSMGGVGGLTPPHKFLPSQFRR